MKRILLFTIAFFLLGTARSQCPAAEILEWEYVNDTTYSLTFDSEVSGTYNLQMNQPEWLGGVIVPNGEVTEGVNTIELAFSSELTIGEPWAGFDMSEPHYLMCNLRVFCDENPNAESVYFYISNASLIQNQNLSCQSGVFPFNENGYSSNQDTIIPINVLAGEEEIDEISVTLDIASSLFSNENDVFQIKLYHPSGISVILDTLDTSYNKSVIYTDNGTQTDIDGSEFSGILIPDESLSTLAGLSPAGNWEIIFTSIANEWFIDYPEVLGVCLNINTNDCSSSFSGTVFYDLNQNNSIDELEPGPSFPIILKNESEEFFGGISGEFWNCPEPGEVTLELLNAPNYYESSVATFAIEEGDHLSGVLLPLTASELLSDVAVDLISLEPNRPGFEADYLAQISNVGTICEDEISVEITFPNYVEIVSSPNPDLIITDNTASIAVDQACPFLPFEFNLTILLDDTVSLETMLEATVSANVSADDPNELNNSFTSVEEVVGSYDPNDKQVSATTIGDEFLEDGSPLKYTIRFQNTGTFYAERVVIADTIDSDLDINSLHIISTSHNMQLVREDNVLYFEFDQIFLPDSATDFDGSIGHVRYEIDPLPTFSEGGTIENTAYIYFDFNEPIVTNTVVTEFGNPLSVSNESTFETRLFPNPADQNITISWEQDVEVDRIEIYDLSGRLVKSRNVSAARNFVMEVNDLTNGMYLLNIVSGALNSRQKFMKLDKL